MDAIAKDQLEGAIRRFEEGDYIAAITLAGAAEEILSRLLEAAGKTPALATEQASLAAVIAYLHRETASPERVGKVVDHPRNKPFLELSSKADASDTIQRAITNYSRLTEDETPIMKRFVDQRYEG